MSQVKKARLEEEDSEKDEQSHIYIAPDETELGIEEFASSHKGFAAVVKQRFSDFIVHEIAEDDEVVKLTTMDPPTIPTDIPYNEAMETLRGVVSDFDINKLESLLDSEQNEEIVEIDVTSLDKDSRKQIHKCIATAFPGLYTSTKDLNGKKMLSVSRTNTFRGKAWSFPGNFTHFVVYQEYHGTFGAVSALSRHLRLHNKAFTYAGTKDKRGISSQRMAVYRLHPNRLLGINRILSKSMTPIAVGNIKFMSSSLKLGQSHGNHFQLVLRDVQAERLEDIEEAFSAVKNNGFINYFGTQRFGIGNCRTDRIGRFILQKEWRSAIESIMSGKTKDISSPWGEDKSFNQLLAKWKETHDAASVYADFYWKDMIEGVILKELSKDKENYRNALLALPRNSRHLYVHAYQSWIWNKVVSERIRNHGLKVLVGDLVFPQDVLEIDYDEEDLDASSPQGNLPLSSKVEPILVTDESLTKVSIFDVVIPLPGTHVLYPQNETGKRMRELIQEEGVDMTLSDNGFSVYGTYRKLLVKPKDLSFQLTQYQRESVRLFATDLEKLQNVKCQPEDFSPECPDRKTAIKVEFSLPASSYATICLREIMRRNGFT